MSRSRSGSSLQTPTTGNRRGSIHQKHTRRRDSAGWMNCVDTRNRWLFFSSFSFSSSLYLRIAHTYKTKLIYNTMQMPKAYTFDTRDNAFKKSQRRLHSSFSAFVLVWHLLLYRTQKYGKKGRQWANQQKCADKS